MKRPLFLCQLLLRCEELSWASHAGLLLDVMLGTSGPGGRQMKSCSDQKAYLAKVDRSTHITKGVISVFWFWGSKNCLPSPKGGRQMKSCSDGKTCLAKVDRSAQVTIEKCPAFFYLGNVSWPRWCCRRCGVAGGAALQAPSECPRRR